MDREGALVKTEKGVEEIATRKYNLDGHLRALLLVVNGEHTAAHLARNFASFGDIPAMLQQLLSEGFIETEAPVDEIRREIVSVINDTLGPGGSAIAEEVESCSSLPALRRYVAARRELFEAALGKQRAMQIWRKVAG